MAQPITPKQEPLSLWCSIGFISKWTREGRHTPNLWSKLLRSLKTQPLMWDSGTLQCLLPGGHIFRPTASAGPRGFPESSVSIHVVSLDLLIDRMRKRKIRSTFTAETVMILPAAPEEITSEMGKPRSVSISTSWWHKWIDLGGTLDAVPNEPLLGASTGESSRGNVGFFDLGKARILDETGLLPDSSFPNYRR